MFNSSVWLKAIVPAIVVVAIATGASAGQSSVDKAAAMVDGKYNTDVKKLFASKCSWCHQGWGMKQADAPKLAGSQKTLEQVMNQIRNGKSPMPAFRSQLSDVQIRALAEYIKALPAD